MPVHVYVSCVPALHSVNVPSELHVADVTLPVQLMVPEQGGRQFWSDGGTGVAARSVQLASSSSPWHVLLNTTAS